jgi:DNA polymerase
MREIIRQKLASATALLEERGIPNNFAAVDFETFYRTEKTAKKLGLPAVTVELQGNWGYCRQPEWNAYMVSIYAPSVGVEYVGPVESAPWGAIDGLVWLSHNRNFDRHVWERLKEAKPTLDWGWFSHWQDTADLAVYCHLPRALAKVTAIAFGLTLDKEARSNMDGKQWVDVDPVEQERTLLYALEDAGMCWLLWAEYAHKWPEHERAASLHTGEIEFRGIPVDRDAVEKDIGTLEQAKFVAERQIPWFNTDDEDGKPVKLRSRAALTRECLKCGVPPPSTTSQKAKEFLDWVDEYGDRVPAVYALARFRKIDRTLAIYRALKARIRPDGRAALGLKYGGAAKTMRWSGANKFNLQNMLKVPLYFTSEYEWVEPNSEGDVDPTVAVHAVDVRARFVAEPGRKLIVPDLSQIEPRVLNWVVRNTEFLKLCAGDKANGVKPMSPYEAHARASMGWTGGVLKKEAPKMYALAKARVLALGYGAGWHKFIEMARGYLGTEEEFLAVFAVTPEPEQVMKFVSYLQWMVDKMKHASSKTCLRAWPELDDETKNIWVNSWVQVQDFRKTNSGIKALWDNLDAAFKASEKDGVFENELPSGRSLKYFGVTSAHGWSCRPADPMGIPQRTYGGLLCENMIQALSRDVFLRGVLRLEAAGYRVLFHVHDEAVIDAPMDAKIDDVVAILAEPLDWCPSLPVGAEAHEMAFYQK